MMQDYYCLYTIKFTESSIQESDLYPRDVCWYVFYEQS